MLDVVVRAQVGVEDGTDVPGTIRFRLGGSAANTARAFAGLGGSAVFIGARGGDELGKRLAAALRASDVTVHAVARRGSTPRLAAVIAPTGERSFVTDRGVADELPRAALKMSWLRRADVLHLPAYSLLTEPLATTSLAACGSVRRRGGIVSIDLASRRPLVDAGTHRVRAQLSAAAPNVLFANTSEVAAVVGRRGAATLLVHAPVVVVKDGAAGCRVLWRADGEGTREIDVATKSISASDTTGAGDAFDAGFLLSLIESGYSTDTKPGVAALRRAAIAGHRSAARLLTRPRVELAL
jgi:sugar/nucleoside kinase (ribokinase family)